VPTTPGLFGLGVDKPVHALSYALLGGLAAAWRGRDGVALVGVVVAVAGFGAGVEVAQLAVPGRTASMGDAAANFVGAVVGVAGWRLWRRSRRRPPERR
jgi:VanZ family protein